jgi:hypothetical protein
VELPFIDLYLMDSSGWLHLVITSGDCTHHHNYFVTPFQIPLDATLSKSIILKAFVITTLFRLKNNIVAFYDSYI